MRHASNWYEVGNDMRLALSTSVVRQFLSGSVFKDSIDTLISCCQKSSTPEKLLPNSVSMKIVLQILLASFFASGYAQYGAIYGFEYGYGIPPPVPPPPYPIYQPYGYVYGYDPQPGSVESIVGGALMGTAFGLLFGKKKKNFWSALSFKIKMSLAHRLIFDDLSPRRPNPQFKQILFPRKKMNYSLLFVTVLALFCSPGIAQYSYYYGYSPYYWYPGYGYGYGYGYRRGQVARGALAGAAIGGLVGALAGK
ncbi:hypothetical protein RB195_014727 [Necator americanus]|uniref:Uncharacterized protein n=1 Tax=Necator americanus TaxID=51031 RepID=A0ABR1E1A6_NECAM